MKLTKSQLKQIIKEELELSKVFNNKPGAKFDNMVGVPISEEGWKYCIKDPDCLDRVKAAIEDLSRLVVGARAASEPGSQKPQEVPLEDREELPSGRDWDRWAAEKWPDDDDDEAAEIAHLKKMIQKQEKRGKGDSAIVAALKAKLKQKMAKA